MFTLFGGTGNASMEIFQLLHIPNSGRKETMSWFEKRQRNWMQGYFVWYRIRIGDRKRTGMPSDPKGEWKHTERQLTALLVFNYMG